MLPAVSRHCSLHGEGSVPVSTVSPILLPSRSFSTDYCSHSLADHSVDRAEFIRVAARKAVRRKTAPEASLCLGLPESCEG